MYYFKWTEKDIKGLNSDGINCVYTEVNEKGQVLKEIGVDRDGKIVHRWPSSTSRLWKYGIFDLAQIDVSVKTTLREETFNRMWNKNLGDNAD